MLLTTQFLTLVMLTVWKVPTPIAICFHLFFSAIEATYFSACAEKVPTGKLELLIAKMCMNRFCSTLHMPQSYIAKRATNVVMSVIRAYTWLLSQQAMLKY